MSWNDRAGGMYNWSYVQYVENPDNYVLAENLDYSCTLPVSCFFVAEIHQESKNMFGKTPAEMLERLVTNAGAWM